jgi:hypothetical protein
MPRGGWFNAMASPSFGRLLKRRLLKAPYSEKHPRMKIAAHGLELNAQSNFTDMEKATHITFKY